MDKNAVLAIALSIGVLVLYQYFLAPRPPAPAPVGKAAVMNAGQAAPGVAPPQASAQKAPSPAPSAPSPVRTIRVETDQYVADFTSAGGVPDYWMLKKYKGETKETGNRNVTLLKPGPEPVLPALAMGSSDFEDAHLHFKVIGGDLRLDKAHPEGKLVFEYSQGPVFIRRTYTFHDGVYWVNIKDEVRGLPYYNLTLGPDFGIYNRHPKGAHAGPVLLSGVKRIEIKPKKLEGGATLSYSQDIKWIAQEDKYFCSALIPVSGIEAARASMQNGQPVLSFTVKNPSVEQFVLYAGPKDPRMLAPLGSGLQYIVDFGFFSILARPILWLLNFINSFVGNYGWSIIILTIVLRIPFLPIVAKGQKSMKKLQAIQPHMQEIRQKYKKDPQRMQKEMMELYKKHKVNPMGGCLPMLVQIPVFFALYEVLLRAIALRGAPFVLWIMDLSTKDPYYVLPILMGISMFVQQKMTPTAPGNPAQQKLMMFMPVIFTVMFVNFASGLVLYWMVNNLLSIAQQAYINRQATV
ncbi:MAG: membrane protein insertase YidC [Nitrospiraceae bacterium]|nr:membrane protein insertase YidC [Nitrospiraceae bacterium]